MTNAPIVCRYSDQGTQTTDPIMPRGDGAMHRRITVDCTAAEQAVGDVRQGIFDLQVQPIRPVDGRTRRLAWFEVLVRPRGCSACDLMGYAESRGIAADIDLSIWRKALSRIRPLQRLSLNVSGQTLCQRDARWQLMRIIDAAPIMAGQVVLEITETAPIDDSASFVPFLRAMRSAGVSIAIDDVRTVDLPIPFDVVDYIKIDRSIVTSSDEKMLASICACAIENGKQLIAEGIENVHDLRKSAAHGAYWFQGFYDRGEGALMEGGAEATSHVSGSKAASVLTAL